MEEVTIRKGAVLLEELDAARRMLKRVSFGTGPAIVDMSSQIARVPGLLTHIRREVEKHLQEEIARLENELSVLGDNDKAQFREERA